MENNLKKCTTSKVNERIQRLIELVSKTGSLTSVRKDIVSLYNEAYRKTDIIPQSAVSNILNKYTNIFKDDGKYITLVDHKSKVEAIRKKFIKQNVKLGSIEHIVLHTNGNAGSVLMTIRSKYKRQVVESRIVGDDIFLSLEYSYDYSDDDSHTLDGSDVASVLRYLDYEINEKKK